MSNFDRDPCFREMIEDLEDQEEKDALLNVGAYLSSEYGYLFSELNAALSGQLEGVIADALMREDSFRPFIDDLMTEVMSKKRRHSSLIAEVELAEAEVEEIE